MSSETEAQHGNIQWQISPFLGINTVEVWVTKSRDLGANHKLSIRNRTWIKANRQDSDVIADLWVGGRSHYRIPNSSIKSILHTIRNFSLRKFLIFFYPGFHLWSVEWLGIASTPVRSADTTSLWQHNEGVSSFCTAAPLSILRPPYRLRSSWLKHLRNK